MTDFSCGPGAELSGDEFPRGATTGGRGTRRRPSRGGPRVARGCRPFRGGRRGPVARAGAAARPPTMTPNVAVPSAMDGGRESGRRLAGWHVWRT